MRNIKLLIEYDGTDFLGWQIQKEGRTVQSVLRDTLNQLMQEEVNLIGAGRTDSGVHARGQVANFKTNSDRDIKVIYKALNGLLPQDIRIHEVSEVPLDFNSRYAALSRTYRYYISLKPLSIGRQFEWYCYYKLDFGLLNQCSEYIKSIKDFKSFCYTRSETKHHLCNIFISEWIKNGDLLIYHVTANRFLYGMVRTLVGTMIDAAHGRMTFDEFKEIFEKRDRIYATRSAPAKGLVLESVKY
jgi:tRNA pseudouridine38-40 synthase